MADIVSFERIKREPFRFRLDGEKVWELPNLGSLPLTTVVRVTDPKDDRETLSVLDELCPGLTDEVETGQIRDILTAWLVHSHTDAGESPASPRQ